MDQDLVREFNATLELQWQVRGGGGVLGWGGGGHFPPLYAVALRPGACLFCLVELGIVFVPDKTR